MTSTRRLAAILVADVVGYSRLMEVNEAGTLKELKHWQTNVLEPAVGSKSGRVVKFMGDGVLIEFASAVNAIECALELQRKMAEWNVPEAQGFTLRIGINLGDIIGEGSDVYGDGVNIAARLETFAEPGAICISEAVHQQVHGKVAAEFMDLGYVPLKNMSQPVHAFMLRRGAATSNPVHTEGGQNRPVILVLPLVNQSGDLAQDYFSNGLTQDITTDLSRFNRLSVIARSASIKSHKLGEAASIGKRLGAGMSWKVAFVELENAFDYPCSLLTRRVETTCGRSVWIFLPRTCSRCRTRLCTGSSVLL